MKTYLESQNYSQKTIQRTLSEIDFFMTWCNAHNLESEYLEYKDIMSFLYFLENERLVKNITKAKYISSLKHYYTFLIEQKIRLDNPISHIHIKGIKRKSYHNILSHQELQELYINYQTQSSKEDFELCRKRNKVILGLFLFQGIDSTSLKLLKEKDIKIRKGELIISQTRRTNQRILKLDALQMMDMFEYLSDSRGRLLELSNKETEKLFFSSGVRNDIQNVLMTLSKQLKKQDHRFTSFKQLRASRITYWIQTENLREVQYRAGHRHISSTENYVVHDIESLKSTIEKYHPF